MYRLDNLKEIVRMSVMTMNHKSLLRILDELRAELVNPTFGPEDVRTGDSFFLENGDFAIYDGDYIYMFTESDMGRIPCECIEDLWHSILTIVREVDGKSVTVYEKGDDDDDGGILRGGD